MSVSVVTPWLGHPELLDDYVCTMKRGPWPDELIVVDNGGAPEVPGAYMPKTPENLGFAKGSNFGLRFAQSGIVILLNNDIAGGREGWLERLAASVEPGVLVGAELCFNRHGDVDGVAYPYLDGWCLGGLREDLAALGAFDERYDEPAYFSDAELCIRARAAGMRLREVRTGIVHKRGRTAGPARRASVQRATRANWKRYQALVRSLA